MRALKYKLENGTVVNTMRDAETADIPYQAFTEDILEARPKMSPIRAAMLEQFGYVSKDLIDKVAL